MSGDTQVIVHRGRNASKVLLSGQSEAVPLLENSRLAKIDIARYNELWSILDDYACAVPGYDTIDVTGRDYPTFADHPWGPYFVHYAMDYYAEFLAGLNRIHLRRTLADPELAMLEQILGRAEDDARAIAADHQVELERHQRRLASQTARIKQLKAERREPDTRGVSGLAKSVVRRLGPGQEHPQRAGAQWGLGSTILSPGSWLPNRRGESCCHHCSAGGRLAETLPRRRSRSTSCWPRSWDRGPGPRWPSWGLPPPVDWPRCCAESTRRPAWSWSILPSDDPGCT